MRILCFQIGIGAMVTIQNAQLKRENNVLLINNFKKVVGFQKKLYLCAHL
jgi:hypothetical protein